MSNVRNEALEAYFTAYVADVFAATDSLADVDNATDLTLVADALSSSVVPPPTKRTRPPDPLTKGRRYACLTEGCAHVFKTWGDAQKHMKDECGFCKPNQGASYAKARMSQYECAICLQSYVDPIMLSCGHSLDRECARLIPISTNAIDCPMCRHPTVLGGSGVDGLPRNFALVDALAALSVDPQHNVEVQVDTNTVLCLTCGFLTSPASIAQDHRGHRHADMSRPLEFAAAVAQDLDAARRSAQDALDDSRELVAKRLTDLEAAMVAYEAAKDACELALTSHSDVSWSSGLVLNASHNNPRDVAAILIKGAKKTGTGGVSIPRGTLVRSLGNGRGMGQLSYPSGVCVIPDGSLVVSDTDMHKLQVCRPSDGVFVRTIGNFRGGGHHQFNCPVSVCVLPDGTTAVCDNYNHRIVIADPVANTFLRTFRFANPNGVCCFPDGMLGVSDGKANKVMIVSAVDGTLSQTFGSGLNAPSSLCPVLPDCISFAVCDTKNNRVVVMSRKDGSVVSVIQDLHQPQGVCCLPDGTLVVCDTGRHVVLVVSSQDGAVLRTIGSPGQQGVGDGQFDTPRGVCVLPDGTIAVCDYANARVQIFS